PVQVWDVATGQLRWSVARQARVLKMVLVSPNSRVLALRSIDQGFMLFDLQSGRQFPRWPGQDNTAYHLHCCFTSDGRYLAIEDSWLGLTRLWDPVTQTIVGQIEGTFAGDDLTQAKGIIGRKLASHGHDLVTYTRPDQGTVKILLWRLPDSGPPVLTKE